MSQEVNRFRIDQVLWNEAGVEVARFSVVGESFEGALVSSQILSAPHLEVGCAIQVVRVGFWCDEHSCYHDASEALAAFGAAGEILDHAPGHHESN